MNPPPAPWPVLCAEFRALDATALRGWVARRFVARALTGDDGRQSGLITGYYEPTLTGSQERETTQQTPLYRKPADLLRVDVDSLGRSFAGTGTPLRGRLQGETVVPYFSRAEIERATPLAGQELLWLDDRVDAFFLQIQGSGRVKLRDGTAIRVGFADHNGQPYRAIGRVLIERGALEAERVDANSIKAWLRAHSDQVDDVLTSNPRYVFMREVPGDPDKAGPPGSLGVALTPMRSVATDPKRIPPGSLLYLSTTEPLSGDPLQRLVLSQDTGAAISGAVRADLFWGAGDAAEQASAVMKQAGQIWLLTPLPADPQPGGNVERSSSFSSSTGGT